MYVLDFFTKIDKKRIQFYSEAEKHQIIEELFFIRFFNQFF